MSSKLEKVIKFLIALTFFVPLVLVSSSFIFPFIVPKIILFRSTTLLLFGVYLLLMFINKTKYGIKVTPINISVAFFLLSFALSTFLGVDWYKSFWDNHERMLGLFTITHFVLYYAIATTLIKEWKDWRWLLRVFLFAGSMVMLVGLWQKIDPEFLLNRGTNRVSATLGNAIYFSGYGLFLFFVGLLLVLKEETKIWKFYALCGSALGFFGIFGGGTRGTFLGLFMGIITLLIVYSFTFNEHKKFKVIVSSLLGLVFVVSVTLFVYRGTTFVNKIPLVGNVLNTSISTGTAGTRIMAWKIAVESWKEKPLFGWGPNNFYYAFNKHYNPTFLEHGWGETWFDNAHSSVFNTLSVQGVVGLLSYFGIFIVSLYALFSAYRKKIIDRHIFAVSSAFLVGHFVHNFFVFENPTSYLYFFFFLAFVNSQTFNRQNVPSPVKKEKNIPTGLSLSIGIVIVLLIYLTDINPARANMATLRTIQSLYSNPILGEEMYIKASSISSPHIDDIRNDFSRSAMEIMTALLQNNKIDEAKKIFTIAYDELQKNRVLHPKDIRVHIQQSQMAGILGQRTNNVNLVIEAEKDLDEALVYSPKRQQIQYMLSVIKLQLGKKDEAIKLLKDSIDSDSKIEEGWWRLAMVYEGGGEHAKAIETINQAHDKGIVFSAQGENVASIIMSSK